MLLAPPKSAQEPFRDLPEAMASLVHQIGETDQQHWRGKVVVAAYNSDEFGTKDEEQELGSFEFPAGGNLGNIIWSTGSRHLLSPKETVLLTSDRQKFARVVYLPTANLLYNASIYPGSDMQASTDRYRQDLSMHSKPVIVVGLGTQMPFVSRDGLPLTAENFTLAAEQANLMRDIQARSTGGIAIRGAFTKRVLERHGITLVRVLGCPSLMLTPDPSLGKRIEANFQALLSAAPQPRGLKIVFSVPNKAWPEHLCETFIGLFNHNPDTVVVLEEVGDYMGVNLCAHNHGATFPEHNFRYFYDYNSWHAEMMSADFVVGARLHNSMMGILAGKPTLLLARDYRQYEMAEAMLVPHRRLDDETFWALPTSDVYNLIRVAAGLFDGTKFDQNRKEIAASYVEMFGAEGLKVNPEVAALAALSAPL